MLTRIPALLLRQVALLLLMLGLAAIIFYTLRAYLPAFLGAYTLYVLLSPLMAFLVETKRWPPLLAAFLLIVLASGILGMVIYALVYLVQEPLVSAIQYSPKILQSIERVAAYFHERYGFDLITAENLRTLMLWVSVQVRALISATLDGVVMALLVIFVLYYMLVNRMRVEKAFYHWLPFSEANITEFKARLNALVFSNALGVPFMGLIQGLAGLPFYWLIGVPDIWLWFAVTCISGMLPVVGVALAYVPLSVVMLTHGEPFKAVALFLYGFVVIGSVDNLGRMWLQRRLGETHPLITLFGVIAGIQLFGFIGLVFGPILIALFLLVVRIYGREFGRSAKWSGRS
ncbi:MAG: AI-2E family transporter [Saprospiraceae bacterium]|nr:AI-2E family transporter [Saprospiraceae bacterium]MDW8484763.1 AI-2E family transporter [Saprospiraceae bacterium]